MLYIAFVLAVAGTVIFASFQKVELVDNNYYDKSLVYQKEIDKKTNSNNLKNNFTLMQGEGNLKIIFPKEIASSGISGNILFFKPNDSKLDFRDILKIDSGNIYQISLNRLVKGRWLIKIDWNGNGTNYYNEEEITIR